MEIKMKCRLIATSIWLSFLVLGEVKMLEDSFLINIKEVALIQDEKNGQFLDINKLPSDLVEFFRQELRNQFRTNLTKLTTSDK